MNNRLRALVAHTSADKSKIICEFLKEFDYEILSVTSSGQEAAELVIKHSPDIVITDVYMHHLDACGMLDLIAKSGYTAKTVFVIATSINSENVIDEVLGRGIDIFTLIPFNKKYLDARIKDLHKRKNSNKKQKTSIISIHDEFDILSYVSNLMHEVGVPASIRGYDYIKESILMALTDRNILKSITKELYPSIAKNNSTTPSRVERAIRHAVEVAWQRGDIDVLNGIFGYTVKSTKGKPTNGEFISMLAERVKLDLKIS